MFNSTEKAESGKKSDKKRTETSFMGKIMFLSKIQQAISNYNAISEAQRKFFSDIHVFIEVNTHDISKENEKAIDEQSNTGSRYHGTNDSRSTY